jgi:hypothetical protein
MTNPIHLSDEEDSILSEYCRRNRRTREAVVAEYVRSLAEDLRKLPEGWRGSEWDCEGEYRGYQIKLVSVLYGFRGCAIDLETGIYLAWNGNVCINIIGQKLEVAIAKVKSLIDAELE